MTDPQERDKRSRGGGAKREASLADVPPGAKITAIEVSKRDPNYRRIRIAGDVVAQLPAGTVDELGLKVDSPWSAELGLRVQDAIDAAAARKTALKLLSKRGLSRAEVRERLVKRGYSEAVADNVVKDMESNGWIDDRAVAESVVRDVERTGPATGEFVREKLRRRKVDADNVAQSGAGASGGSAGGGGDLDAAEKFARRRLEKMGAEVKPAARARRVARALAGRGFDEDTISTILDRVKLGPDARASR